MKKKLVKYRLKHILAKQDIKYLIVKRRYEQNWATSDIINFNCGGWLYKINDAVD